MTARTAGPWRIERGAVRDAKGRSIAWTNYASGHGCSQRIDYNEKFANEQHIVTACNAYDGLVADNARLRGALERIEAHESRADHRHRGMVDASELADLQRIARSALKGE